MRVSTARSASLALDVSSRYNDSGVVMRISSGSRGSRARSAAGVSPVRMAMEGVTYVSPRPSAICAIPDSGARRLRWTSIASALRGDTYRTRHRRVFGGGGENLKRSRHHRKAASVLPLPVAGRLGPRSREGRRAPRARQDERLEIIEWETRAKD